MAKSILQDDCECFVCGTTRLLERHHVFGAANRKRSERDGMTVYLCKYHHNMPPEGVHFNKKNRELLQAYAQKAWMDYYGKTKEDFLAAYGRNYVP